MPSRFYLHFLSALILSCVCTFAAHATEAAPPSQWRDGRLWGANSGGDRAQLLRAIDANLRLLNSRRTQAWYSRPYLNRNITRPYLIKSLRRFRQVLEYSPDEDSFYKRIEREFVFVPIHETNRKVHFTAYYTPEYSASRTRTAQFRYPLFGVPAGFSRWPQPHPAREMLEGRSGQNFSPRLRGSQLGFVANRLDAFLAHVQGSARLRFSDGKILQLGYAGATSHPYTSIGRELVRDRKISWDNLTMPAVREYFRSYPDELNEYLPRNERFVFFRRTTGLTRGSLGVSLVPQRSIATDKEVLPPGALFLSKIDFQNPVAQRIWRTKSITRFLLDADSGSAIKGRQRVDFYSGAGANAEERAGVINSSGQMYLLLLRNRR